jgi:galactokinase
MPQIRKKRWPFVTLVIVMGLLIVAGLVIAWQIQNTNRLEAQRNDAYLALDGAIARIQEADVTVMAIDTAVDTQITEETPSERGILLNQTEGTRETLSYAVDQATTAKDLFADSSDVELAQHVIDAANARLDMVGGGAQLVSFDIEALSALEPFSAAWAAIVKADGQMRDAANLAAKSTKKDVQAAVKQNQKAQKSLKTAADNLDSAVAAFNELDVSALSSYVTLKTEAVKLAIEADKALLANDQKTAKAKNKAFNLKDAEVVKAAQAIPAEPMDLLTQSYETATADLRQNYTLARSNAADSDIFIRAYVGVDTMTQVQ